MILDTTIYQERDERAAAAVLALIQNPDVPEFITQAVENALSLASGVVGVEYASCDKGEFVPGALADLITLSRGRDIKHEPPDLARMIMDVWEHPDCPDDITKALDAGTSELFNTLNEGSRRVYKTTAYVRALILEHKAQKGGDAR